MASFLPSAFLGDVCVNKAKTWIDLQWKTLINRQMAHLNRVYSQIRCGKPRDDDFNCIPKVDRLIDIHVILTTGSYLRQLRFLMAYACFKMRLML